MAPSPEFEELHLAIELDKTREGIYGEFASDLQFAEGQEGHATG
jgi:hypothetical protein